MIKKYTCQNGVRIVLEKIPSVRSVAIGIWIRAGSRYEAPELNGVSHFLEHMLFKGTKTRTAQDIAETFDRIGGQVNAFTSKEYTCYYAKVLDTHAGEALEVLHDMFFHSVFDDNELMKEKSVVLEEIKMYEDTPDDHVHDLLSKAIFGDHPIGFPILGTEETLQTFSGDVLRSYMEKMYTPENVVISVAGNIDETFIKEIEKYFGSFEGGKGNIHTEAPSFHQYKLTRKKDTEQAHLCLGFEGLPFGHKDIYSLIIANNILGGSMSSRLFQEVREKRGLAYSVYSYHSSFEDCGYIAVYAGTGKEQLPSLFETIQETIEQFVSNGITDKEISNRKEQLKGNLMLGLEGTNSRMSRNGKNELLLKKHRTLDEVIHLIDSVKKEDVNELIQNIFSKESAVALISPDGNLASLKK